MNVMTNGAIALWILTNFWFLGTVNALAAADDKQYFADSSLTVAAEETGFQGVVNAGEVVAIMNLSFPQRYQSIKNRFGSPFSRDRYRDFYKIEGARNWVAIEYRGTEAVGYIIINQD